MTWLTIECDSAHYVDRGRHVILCDRLPHPVTLVVKLRDSDGTATAADCEDKSK